MCSLYNTLTRERKIFDTCQPLVTHHLVLRLPHRLLVHLPTRCSVYSSITSGSCDDSSVSVRQSERLDAIVERQASVELLQPLQPSLFHGHSILVASSYRSLQCFCRTPLKKEQDLHPNASTNYLNVCYKVQLSPSNQSINTIIALYLKKVEQNNQRINFNSFLIRPTNTRTYTHQHMHTNKPLWSVARSHVRS